MAVGMVAGAHRLFDNSFLTHLATGRLIWDGGGIPYEDPYSFTAAGRSWAAQSWFASTIYGGAEKLGGLEAVRLQFSLTAGLLAGLGWLLTRSAGDVLRRTIAVAPFLLLAAWGWSHRPYVIGLICLALVLLATEDRLDPRWLLLVGWVWLNSHGGWPLGLVAAAALWAGRRLDGDEGRAERRAAMWLAGGLVVGCIGPYGPRLLAFPFVAFERRDAFRRIVEWQAPTFEYRDELVFLVVIAGAMLALRRAPSWHRAVPAAVFTAMALVSARNVQVAALVLLPGIAEGCRRREGAIGEPFAALARPVAAVAIALAALTVGTALTDNAFEDGPYPVEATSYLEERDLGPTTARVVSLDFVGNYWEARFGTRARVFVDDRVELFPIEILDDYATLVAGAPDWQEALDRYEPTAVLWDRDRPLAQLLRLSADWRIAYEDDTWVVALRR